MKITIKKKEIIPYIYVQLLVLAPIISIIGNLAPSIGGVKISWVYWFSVLLIGLLVLAKYILGLKYLLFLFLFFTLNFLFKQDYNIKIFLSVLNNFTIIYIIYMLIDKKLFNRNIIKFLSLQYILQIILILFISLGQYVKILPLTLLNSKYVNLTHLDTGEIVSRINGYFYHPIDLSLFFYFSIIFLFFIVKIKYRYLVFMLLVVVMYMVRIKMGLLLALLSLMYYFLFVDGRYKKLKMSSLLIFVVVGFYVLLNFIPEKQLKHFKLRAEFPYFPSQFITGRGAIWNVYLKGIEEQFHTSNYIFGYGFDTFKDFFAKALTKELWYPERIGKPYYPGTHNTILQIFMYGGMFLMVSVLIMIRKMTKQIKLNFNPKNSNLTYKTVLLFLIIFPFITFGMTMAVLNINFFWANTMLVIMFITSKYRYD